MKSGDPLAAWVLAAGLLAGCPVAPPRGGSTDEPPVRPAAPAAGPGEAPEEAPATADWPEAALAPTLRGVALLEQGRPVEAEPALAAAAEAGPGFAPVRFNLGLGRYLRGESPAGALAEFRAAAGLDPSLPGPRFGAACILEALGDTEGALKALEAARDLAPDEATVPFVRGRCLRRMGRPEEAIPHFGAATRLDPLLSSAWYALGQAEQAMGHAGPAREALAEFQRLRASGADRAWGSEYGEQGPLLVALEPTPLPGAWWPPVAPPEGARTARALADFDND
ncbi:MAG: tetratricopeptide repeat protein, partial [Planctomycetes bacterium]|nr:tetratricopeptide repeat protein [Planctomycetota bacterium]